MWHCARCAPGRRPRLVGGDGRLGAVPRPPPHPAHHAALCLDHGQLVRHRDTDRRNSVFSLCFLSASHYVSLCCHTYACLPLLTPCVMPYLRLLRLAELTPTTPALPTRFNSARILALFHGGNVKQSPGDDSSSLSEESWEEDSMAECESSLATPLATDRTVTARLVENWSRCLVPLLSVAISFLFFFQPHAQLLCCTRVSSSLVFLLFFSCFSPVWFCLFSCSLLPSPFRVVSHFSALVLLQLRL